MKTLIPITGAQVVLSTSASLKTTMQTWCGICGQMLTLSSLWRVRVHSRTFSSAISILLKLSTWDYHRFCWVWLKVNVWPCVHFFLLVWPIFMLILYISLIGFHCLLETWHLPGCGNTCSQIFTTWNHIRYIPVLHWMVWCPPHWTESVVTCTHSAICLCLDSLTLINTPFWKSLSIW